MPFVLSGSLSQPSCLPKSFIKLSCKRHFPQEAFLHSPSSYQAPQIETPIASDMTLLMLYLTFLSPQTVESRNMKAETKSACSWTFLQSLAKMKSLLKKWLIFRKQIDEWIFAFVFATADADLNFAARQDIQFFVP